ncbi:MAG TPA: substrate-binding domain-containing protein [Candidatus Eisenbacteria bacterium]|nr:substrate-binding domain-containing protein [Candidatus Eisenbacteria bacterium]
MRTNSLCRPWFRVVVTAVAALLAACGGASSGTTGGEAATSFLSQAQANVQRDYQSTDRMPDPTSRPAAKGKKIVVISAGDEGESASVPVHAALAAAKAIGWQATEYDEHLDPTKGPALMRQAIAAGADGIIVDANDCPLIKAPLQEAQTAHIAVVPIYAYDCDDPLFNGGPALFSGAVQVATAGTPDEQALAYGANQADAVIVATKGHARVVLFNDVEFTVLHYTGEGFKKELAKCSDCKIVDEVDFKAAELGPALQQKASSALLQHPEANAVKIPYTAASLLGIAGAVVQSGRASQLYVMGGEGFADELELIRGGKGVNAVNIISSEWTGWAAVDTLNSAFLGQKPKNSGIGWTLSDSSHNLPASGPFVPKVDFKAAYMKAWGMGA